MDLVAVHCRRCSCFYLESTVAIAAGNAVCDCGGVARVLPEHTYTQADQSLFDAVVTCLEVGGVSWSTAPDLARTLGTRGQQPGVALNELARSVPALEVIGLIVQGDPRRARRAEGMLESLLRAIAATRSRSGFTARVSARAKKATD